MHQLLDQPLKWQTSQQAGPGSMQKFTIADQKQKHQSVLIESIDMTLCVISFLVSYYRRITSHTSLFLSVILTFTCTLTMLTILILQACIVVLAIIGCQI